MNIFNCLLQVYVVGARDWEKEAKKNYIDTKKEKREIRGEKEGEGEGVGERDKTDGERKKEMKKNLY